MNTLNVIKKISHRNSSFKDQVGNMSGPNTLDNLKLSQALKLANKNAELGNYESAKNIYQDIITRFPGNKKARCALKTLIKKAVVIQKDAPLEQRKSVLNLVNQGQFHQALTEANIMLKSFPSSAFLHAISGAANAGLNKFDATLASYEKALNIQPDYADVHYSMGVVLQNKGDLDAAVASYEKALKIQPSYAHAYNNMGNALKDKGNLDAAIIAYKQALKVKPDLAEAFNNMGNVLIDKGNLEAAIISYKRALKIRPTYLEAWLNGAEELEKWNKISQLELWLDQAFQAFEAVPADIKFLQAKLLWRSKNFEKALHVLKNIELESITDKRKQDYLNLKAKCFEKLKDFDQAFGCFIKMNWLARTSNDFLKCSPENYFQVAKDNLAKLKSRPVPVLSDDITDGSDASPVFLVGFPRSGTTLLDTILRSHSGIEVVEEQPNVRAAKVSIQKNGYDDIINHILPPEVLVEARNAYHAELSKHVNQVNPNSVFIDKLPLNLLRTPLIHHLYPRSKYILALRHPLDTILSCWMQDFKLNAAMANMVDLDRIVELYCVAMATFKICRTEYDLSVHIIRYEDLIDDLSGETTTLLNFLNLSWEAQMVNYRDTALKRGQIRTPSYSQVVQPIYKDSKYRWLSYEKYLEKYFEQVEPWIEEFGYS